MSPARKGRQAPIGIFDSGVGGLTVVKEIRAQLPCENFAYLGDTARTPYGSKARETVTRFTLESVEHLLTYGIKALVVACNTASSVALPALRRRLTIPVLGVIESGARAAVRASDGGAIGVIGTRTTVASRAYLRTIVRLHRGARVYSQACPLLVPLVEEGWLDGPIPRRILRTYLEPLLAHDLRTLILGCTHYPVLKHALARVCGAKVRLIDSAEEVTKELKRTLERAGLLNPGPRIGTHRYLVTDVPGPFARVARYILGERRLKVRRVLVAGGAAHV